jgi:hypothetical protein
LRRRPSRAPAEDPLQPSAGILVVAGSSIGESDGMTLAVGVVKDAGRVYHGIRELTEAPDGCAMPFGCCGVLRELRELRLCLRNILSSLIHGCGKTREDRVAGVITKLWALV